MNYKSGDLVKIAGNNNNHDFSMGEIVRLKHNCGGEHRVWAAEYLDGHDFWYVLESDMKPFKPAIMPQKIVITTDGKTTLARLFDGKTMVKRAEAKCAPSDTFDFGVGAELAVKRLMGAKPVTGIPVTEPVKESKPEPMKLYGAKSLSCLVTKGKLYEFVNGDIALDDGLRADGAYSDYPHFVKDNPRISACLVPLVRRPAKVGEWILPSKKWCEFSQHEMKPYKVISVYDIGRITIGTSIDDFWYGDMTNEYLVLNGYHGDSE